MIDNTKKTACDTASSTVNDRVNSDTLNDSASALLREIQIVLVEPTHPGNIGSVARAMKTMALSSLVLVNPKKFPHYEASKLAAGAESVLADARVVTSVTEAIGDSTLVLGTSVRDREVSWPTEDPKATSQIVFDHACSTGNAKIAILFGRESSGLTNDELDLCQRQIRIDANPEYSSLNLANAVQIISYELRMRAIQLLEDPGLDDCVDSDNPQTGQEKRQQAATQVQLEGHIQHLQNTLEALDFINVKPPTVLMRKLTRLYNKAQLSVEEIQILRGILSATQQKIDGR